MNEIKGSRMGCHMPLLGPRVHRDVRVEGLSKEDIETPGGWVQQKGRWKPLAAQHCPAPYRVL